MIRPHFLFIDIFRVIKFFGKFEIRPWQNREKTNNDSETTSFSVSRQNIGTYNGYNSGTKIHVKYDTIIDKTKHFRMFVKLQEHPNAFQFKVGFQGHSCFDTRC